MRQWHLEGDVHEMDFFKFRGYTDHVKSAAVCRSLFIIRADAFTSNTREHKDRSMFPLTYHLHNISVEIVIFRYLSFLCSDPSTSAVFSETPLRDRNLGGILVHTRVQASHPPSPLTAPASS